MRSRCVEIVRGPYVEIVERLGLVGLKTAGPSKPRSSSARALKIVDWVVADGAAADVEHMTEGLRWIRRWRRARRAPAAVAPASPGSGTPRAGQAVDRVPERRALARAWLDALGSDLGAEDAEVLVVRGWTPADAQWLAEVVVAGFTRRRVQYGLWLSTTEAGTRRAVGDNVATWALRMDRPVLLLWAGLLALAAEDEEQAAIRWLLDAHTMSIDVGLVVQHYEDAGPVVLHWWQMPDGLGALGWAAGLTVTEMEAQMAAGTVDVAGLEVLAALRGYALRT